MLHDLKIQPPQAFKRACSCFGLGRYFYDVPAIWIGLDQNRQPVKPPVLSAWALPENWRKGMRPRAEIVMENPKQRSNAKFRTQDTWQPRKGNESVYRSNDGSGHRPVEKFDGSPTTNSAKDLDQRILGMEKAVGTAFYRNILWECGRVNQPKRIRDAVIKQKVLQMLESAARGIDRLDAVLKRTDPNTVQALLANLHAPPLGRIADIKTLQNVVLGLEELTGPSLPPRLKI